MVDRKELAFNPAVELSYLKPHEQEQFLDAMDQPLLLLDGPAYRDAMARTLDEERELLRRLKLLP